MSSQIENVSIDLRNLDGTVLVGESEDEYGGKSSRRPAVEDILKNHDKAMHRWNTFFIVVCALAVFVDPLFFYIPFVKDADHGCIENDMTLFWEYCGLRIACDVFYLIDFIISVCGICKKRKGQMFFACCSKERRELPLKERFKKLLLSILPRILVSLFIPGLLGLIFATDFYIGSLYFMIIITPFQYIVRIFLSMVKDWRPFNKAATGRWLKPLLDFLPFILASHLFGALWYILAVKRQMDCWKQHCNKIGGFSCDSLFEDECAFPTKTNTTLVRLVQELCPTKAADPKNFDFGIYFYAVQSNVTSRSNPWQRILVSFWWALRNLSSFGSNLNTSMDPVENFFSVVISICGMFLFLVYLNAIVEASQAWSNQHKLKDKKQSMILDIDLWLSKNDLSKNSKDLKTTIKRKTLKMVIIENIDKLEENKDIDLQNIISVLPTKFKKNIARLLCLASLSEVPMLANLNAKMLKMICEHLKPVIYTEDNYIVQEGKPLGMMIFVTQGLAWSYTTDDGGTSCGSSTTKWLRRGDFYGEELLHWAFKSPSYTALPFSTRTVLAQEKVEAFTLRASDLKNIVRDFWWHFTIELKQEELVQWENAAASSIQAAWRNHLAKAKRSNRWDKLTAHY